MIKEAAIVIPTRDRIPQLVSVIRCLHQRQTEADIYVGVDSDQIEDHETAFEELPEKQRPIVMEWRGDCGKGVAAKLNWMGILAASSYDYVLFGANDVFPVTARWDAALIDAIRGVRFGVSYPDDGIQRCRLPSNGTCFDSRFIQKMGWLCMPALQHMYVDNVWKDVAQGISSLRYCEHVVVDHRHPAIDGSLTDALYQRTEPLMRSDGRRYRAWKAGGPAWYSSFACLSGGANTKIPSYDDCVQLFSQA